MEESLTVLSQLGRILYPDAICQELLVYWSRALSQANPLWSHLRHKTFIEHGQGKVTHLIAMIDERLPGVGFIGFYETDREDSNELIQSACKWLRHQGGKHIVSLFDGSILQRYRFNNETDQAFAGEPVNPSYYQVQFKAAGFKSYNHYVSGIREDYNTILPQVEAATLALPKDFFIREIDLSNFEADLKIIYDLSIPVFRGTSPYFVEYSFSELAYWYVPRKSQISPRYLEFLYHKDRPIGACHSFVQNNQLVMKTIGVLPEFQNQGISRTLIYSQHKKAHQDGLSAVIYALVRTGNAVTKMPYPGVKIYRTYQTMVLG